jgi:hypothetical protein
MTPLIASFFALGVLFGLLTYSNRHRFSEGPTTRSENGPRDPMDGRLMWVLISSCLWPILALTGIYSFWRLARVKAAGPVRGPR